MAHLRLVQRGLRASEAREGKGNDEGEEARAAEARGDEARRCEDESERRVQPEVLSEVSDLGANG